MATPNLGRWWRRSRGWLLETGEGSGANGVLVVGRVEGLCTRFCTDHERAWQHLGNDVAFKEQLGCTHLDGVGDECTGDGRRRPHGGIETGESHGGIADWRAGVEYDIGDFEEPLPV